jgi:hypothetical protein
MLNKIRFVVAVVGVWRGPFTTMRWDLRLGPMAGFPARRVIGSTASRGKKNGRVLLTFVKLVTPLGSSIAGVEGFALCYTHHTFCQRPGIMVRGRELTFDLP